jgi:hypothetical protein
MAMSPLSPEQIFKHVFDADKNALRISGVAGELDGPVTFAEGLGAVTHIEGPTDQNLIIAAGTGRAISLLGGLKLSRTAPATIAFPYTALPSDFIIAVTDTSAARTVNLPAAATAGAGTVYVIADESGVCSVNNITIDAYLSELIDGFPTYVISSNNASVTIYSTGNSWKIC